MTTAKPKSLPGDVQVTFDLDAATRPADEVVAPFVVNVGGKAITMTDPAEFDWEDLLDIESPEDFLRHCLSDEDREHFYNQPKMPGWKLGLLMENYQKHYKLADKQARAEKEARRLGRR